MIKLKDLDRRGYVGPKCTEFDYIVRDEKNVAIIKAEFHSRGYLIGSTKEWSMRVVTERTRDADSQVYRFDYSMPKENLPLELIAATGLKFFQLYLKREMDEKMSLSFAIADVTEGM